jgi:hypothetical protein
MADWSPNSSNGKRTCLSFELKVSDWLLFNANSAIFQLYHGENKLIFNEMMKRSIYTTVCIRYNCQHFVVWIKCNWMATFSVFVCEMFIINLSTFIPRLVGRTCCFDQLQHYIEVYWYISRALILKTIVHANGSHTPTTKLKNLFRISRMKRIVAQKQKQLKCRHIKGIYTLMNKSCLQIGQ